MQNFRNYYQILGVAKTATEDEIKRAFRRLARQCHPDLNPGNKEAEERFKVIGEAYEILSDPDRRARYDQFSRFWKQKGFQGGPTQRASKSWSSRPTGGFGNDVDYSQFPDFNTFVEDLLGKAPRKSYSRTTVTRRVVSRSPNPPTSTSPPRQVPVSPSDGSQRFFRQDDSDPRTASYTQAPRSQSAIGSSTGGGPGALGNYRPGITKTAYTIPSRHSRRDVEARLELPLEKAYQGGQERIRLEDGRAIEVDMPGGLVTGQKVRLRGQGLGGGDLYLCITVKPHPFFRLQGADLYCEVPVTVTEAILGVPVDVPTLDGVVQMTLPVGVRSGQRLRLAEKGYPTVDGGRGDQIVEVQVVLPTQLSHGERSLYEQIYAIEALKPRQRLY